MAKETVTKSSRFYCVSTIPDFCKTPIGPATPPLPYTIKGEFKETSAASPNVKSHSEPVFLHNKSFIPTVTGDEPGVAKGIKSNTVGKRVESLTFSPTYGSNTTQTIQEGGIVWMNDRNTIGQIYERGGKAQAPLHRDLSSQFEATLKETGQQVKSGLQALSGEINQKTKEMGHALTDAGSSILSGIQNKIEQTRIALQPIARTYQQDISAGLHQFGQDAMSTGGKVAMGSAGVALVGAGVAATGIGVPVAVVMEAGAVAGGTVGGVVTGVGAAADSGAVILDKAAAWITTGKTPDIKGAALEIGSNLAEKVVAQKIGPVTTLASKLIPKGMLPKPGQVQPPKITPPPPPKPTPPPNRTGALGGRTKPNKREKTHKPEDTCPKNCATKGISASSKKPVHYGTGEEILYQTDFELGGSLPLAWTRCYRSGSETEDWGLLGARWATEFTESLSSCKLGMVFHDATGRCLPLPRLEVGESHDCVDEGFIIQRDHDEQYTLTWRDGEQHIHQRGPNGWLPHGYAGVNMMKQPGKAILVRRYHLTRKQARDGRGYSVAHFPQALVGEVLLRVVNDDGRVLEAMRAPALIAPDDTAHLPVIGQIDEVHADGSRICHVRYDYALEANPHALPAPDYFEAPDAAFTHLPPRANLIRQTDKAQRQRIYQYRHHLLTRYSSYNAFAFVLDWISLTALRERWQGSDLPQADLGQHFPIHLGNSYQARAIATSCANGSWRYEMDYQDEDSTKVTEPDGSVYEFHFNHMWLATKVELYLPGKKYPETMGRRRWNSQGMLLEDIDARDFITRYEYDAAGNLISEADPYGHTTHTAYNTANSPVRIIDAMGQSTALEYDAQQRIIAHIDALHRTTRYEYNAKGQLVAVIDAKGGRSELAYDANGNLASHTDCSGYTSRYRFDANGNVLDQTNAIGQCTSYQYDVLNRLHRITWPDQTSERYEYDVEDNLTAHIDPKGQITRYQFNGHNLPIERIDSQGNRHQYRYDAALRLVELVNGNGESYTFTYHPQGWLASETGFDGKTTLYQYNNAGQLTGSTCAGQKTEFLHDSLGQLIGKTNNDGATRYAYDPLGRLIAVANAQAENYFRFDPVGQLIEERTLAKINEAKKRPVPLPFGWEAPASEYAFCLEHQYDELGNRIQTTLPNGRKIDTLRYGSGHWHGTLWQGQSVVDVERDGLHREIRRSMGAHLQMQRGYDNQSRQESFRFERKFYEGSKLSTPGVQQRKYSYDATGNLIHIIDTQRGTLHYRYDPLGQLLAAVQPGLVETFAFDPAGNLLDPPLERRRYPRREFVEKPIPKVTYNLLKKYLGNLYEYDIQGNTVAKHPARISPGGGHIEQNYAYDIDNRLIHSRNIFANRTQYGEYVYDAFNRRIAKRVMKEQFEPGTGKLQKRDVTTTFFVWDGDVLLQEITANAKAEGMVDTTTYLYEPDSFVPLARMESQDAEEIYARGTVYLPHVADWDWLTVKESQIAHVIDWANWHNERIHAAIRGQRAQEAQENAGQDQRHYYQVDHLGTPLELFDTDGNTVWSAKYRAWGGVWEFEVAQVKQPLRFQGQYADDETGLHYNRHRYYDPETARFVTQDPIGLVGGENLFRYTPNPTGWVDTLGLAPCQTSINLKHIFHGETNRRGRPTGFHHQGSIGHADKAVVVHSATPNTHGVYSARVGVLNPASGVFQTKFSTMFPDSWSRTKVLNEIRSAHQDAVTKGTVNGNKFKGTSCSGVEIEGYLDSTGNINTAYPII